jgi:formylmethanofuran dehydrogenase subunit A
MKQNFTVLAFLALAFFSVNAHAQTDGKYKCMVQMSNYPGEGAYIIASLINPKGQYEQTLYVFGRDKKWYPDLTEWWKFQKPKKQNLSAITGASISGGERSVNVIDIDPSKIDAGYTIRFETAVENQKYNVNDLEVPLTKQNVSGKTEGTNYIRYVRLIPN